MRTETSLNPWPLALDFLLASGKQLKRRDGLPRKRIIRIGARSAHRIRRWRSDGRVRSLLYLLLSFSFFFIFIFFLASLPFGILLFHAGGVHAGLHRARALLQPALVLPLACCSEEVRNGANVHFWLFDFLWEKMIRILELSWKNDNQLTVWCVVQQCWMWFRIFFQKNFRKRNSSGSENLFRSIGDRSE